MSKATTIYAICHPITHEVRYIGKTVNLKHRIKAHNKEARDGNQTWKSRWIRSLWCEDLKPEFIELVILSPNEDWEDEEQFYIQYFRFIGARLCNLTKGGEGALGQTKSIELRQRMSELNKGKKMSEESRRKISEAQLGRKWSEESLKKRTEKQRGLKRSQETREKMSKAMKGKKKSTTINMSGENSPHSSISECVAKQILYVYYTTKLKHREISEMCNVSTSTVSCIVAGSTWKHLNWYREELIMQYGDRPKRKRKDLS